MKKALVVLAVMLGMSCSTWAARYEGNPDKVPSIGLNYSGVAEEGDVTVIASPQSAKQDIETSSGLFLVDLRMPVSNNVTFNAAIGFNGTTSEAKETALLTGQKAETSGVSFNIGLRFYLQ